MILFDNYPLFAAFSAIIISQIIKVPVALLLKRPSSVALATSTGGMPSSHSAGVTALITSLIAEYGIQSPYVAIASTFGVIVMFDSMGVRRQSGEHGILINELLADFEELRKTFTHYTQEDIKKMEEERQSREYLGHKPIEVFFGILSGIIIALVIGLLY
ncbi:hypothetical protein ADIAL_1542 [Alkalibacterium sp. AK22]|uniref:divergent PAP2 family protein n=1 Tax=Alkalibacterium sp. AK22 TaxID=1229520 RepID=UPI00044E7B4C|nr:divergent PAP2 family protein [Alkalibacterium sp. AK22]EXJ22919.1 hypothetical protein ADIAL_1542 [Alkalibacterium sp. AK22]